MAAANLCVTWLPPTCQCLRRQSLGWSGGVSTSKACAHAKLWLVLPTGTACVHEVGEEQPSSRSQPVPDMDGLVTTT